MKITTFLLSSILFFQLSAQLDMRESIGLTMLRAVDTEPASGGGQYGFDDLSATFTLFNYNLNYAYAFDSGNHGVGFNVGTCVGLRTNYFSKTGLGAHLAFDIPISFQYLFGYLANEDSDYEYGGLFGVGASYLFNSGTTPYFNIIGPHVEGGVSFPTAGDPLTVKLKFMPVSNQHVWSISASLLYPLNLFYPRY